MFNFFKTKEPEIPVYVPKINDTALDAQKEQFIKQFCAGE